jgi:hypothetical protein
MHLFSGRLNPENFYQTKLNGRWRAWCITSEQNDLAFTQFPTASLPQFCLLYMDFSFDPDNNIMRWIFHLFSFVYWDIEFQES